MSQTYDAIIIGAGVMGASLAFHLSQRGSKVVILEKKTVASGATGHSSGLIRMHYDLQVEAQLAFESYQYFANWKEKVGGDCGFTRTGFLQIEPRANEAKMRGNVENQKKLGINTSMISASEVKEIAPDFTTDDFDFAAYEPDSGYADATLTTNSFLESAKRQGATLIQDCEVTGIQISGGKVNGVTTTKGVFFAPIVINAAGNWGAQIGKMVGLEIPMVTWTHDVAFLVRPKGLRPFPAFIDDSIAMYGRPEGSSLVLAALEEDSFRNEEPGVESQKTAPEFIERLIEKICQRMPKMEESGVHSIHVGRDGLPPDQRAIFGPAGPDGFYLACGLSGTGFKTSPIAGRAMTEWILDGAPKSVDISSFHFDRFASGKLLKGEHAYGNIWK
ncbi:MAG: FAD-binding oxidoreductase [Anaerolineales bacterium]|nr:FAD-binding oxidoreductase [Anaerolineales bacterium]